MADTNDTAVVDPQTSSTANVEKCHLLLLCGELRNKIYNQVIEDQCGGQGWLSKLARRNYWGEAAAASHPHRLASRCKQIRHEILSICFTGPPFSLAHIFGDHYVSLKSPFGASHHDRKMHISRLAYIRDIEMDVDISTPRQLFAEMRVRVHMTELGKLEIAEELLGDAVEECCRCVPALLAYDAGAVGAPTETPMVRFLKAMSKVKHPIHKPGEQRCERCGNMFCGIRVLLDLWR